MQIQWFDSKVQEFPTEAQQQENFERNGSNEYLAVIKHRWRNTHKLRTVPVNLWAADYCKHMTDFWQITGTDEDVVPIKWALMPEPEGDLE